MGDEENPGGLLADPIEERDIQKLLAMLGDERVKRKIASFIIVTAQLDMDSFFASARVCAEIKRIAAEPMDTAIPIVATVNEEEKKGIL